MNMLMIEQFKWTREPEDSRFKAVFTNMEITECAWKAHDGQQPD